VSPGCSVCRDDLGDGGAHGGVVDDGLAGGAGGDERGEREAVDGSGFAAGGVVDLGDVGSAQGAVPGFRPARFPGPSPA
jgi:hypothetical protein